MNKNNVLFLGEYKKLNDLCKDNLDMDEGIAAYIKEMELSEGPKKNIDGWIEDYHNLNKCLHIGSVLENNEVMLGRAQCTKQDVAWLKKFQQRISKGEDPVVELQKYHEKLRLVEEKKKHFEPYVEKAAACLMVAFIFLLALADSKNKKKIEEQMKAGKKKKEKKAKKKKNETVEAED